MKQWLTNLFLIFFLAPLGLGIFAVMVCLSGIGAQLEWVSARMPAPPPAEQMCDEE